MHGRVANCAKDRVALQRGGREGILHPKGCPGIHEGSIRSTFTLGERAYLALRARCRQLARARLIRHAPYKGEISLLLLPHARAYCSERSRRLRIALIFRPSRATQSSFTERRTDGRTDEETKRSGLNGTRNR